jgi:hypothetical protein
MFVRFYAQWIALNSSGMSAGIFGASVKYYWYVITNEHVVQN